MPDIITVLSEDTDYKGAEWSLNGLPTNESEFKTYFVIHKLNGKKTPTWVDVQKKLKVMQVEYNAKEYQRKREPEYPSIPDQLDDLYHNGIDGWKATIKVTKDKYPKP